MIEKAVAVTDELRKLRLRAKLTMDDMAKALGMRRGSSYQRYENATLFKKPYLPRELVEKLLNVLVGKGKPPIEPHEILELSGFHKIDIKEKPLFLSGLQEAIVPNEVPIISAQQVDMFSKQLLPSEAAEGFVSAEGNVSRKSFCLVVTDSSMSPVFNENDRLICDMEAEIRPGDYVVAKLTGEIAAAVRRYRVAAVDQSGPIIELIPANPDYPTVTMSAGTPGTIYAKVVEHRRKL